MRFGSSSKKHELIETLNLNRKVSEKSVKKIIKEDNICSEIKGLIYSTINISREQIGAQNEVIHELRVENDQLRSASESLQKQLDRNRQISSEKELHLNEVIVSVQRQNRELGKEIQRL